MGVEWLALDMLMPRLWAVPGAETLERAGDEAEYDGKLTASEATYASCVCKKGLILIISIFSRFRPAAGWYVPS